MVLLPILAIGFQSYDFVKSLPTNQRQAIAVMLGGTDEVERDLASNVVYEIDDRRMIPFLIEGLRAADSQILGNCASRLCEWREPRAVPILLERLSSDDYQTRRSAAYVLGYFGDRRAIPGLISGLKDPDSYVRVDAAASLAMLHSRVAIGELGRLSHNHDANIRFQAAQALKEVRHPRQIPVRQWPLPMVHEPALPDDFQGTSFIPPDLSTSLEKVGIEWTVKVTFHHDLDYADYDLILTRVTVSGKPPQEGKVIHVGVVRAASAGEFRLHFPTVTDADAKHGIDLAYVLADTRGRASAIRGDEKRQSKPTINNQESRHDT